MQKCYLRCFMRKPAGVKTRVYLIRLKELNQYLTQFPDGNENSSLDDDKLSEILEFSVPSSWQKNMILQGFDFTTQMLDELVEF